MKGSCTALKPEVERVPVPKHRAMKKYREVPYILNFRNLWKCESTNCKQKQWRIVVIMKLFLQIKA